MQKKQHFNHPYSTINIKRQNMQQILFDTVDIPWGQQQNYSISSKLGRGRYAHVFSGHDVRNKKKVAIKVLLPIKPNKIRREYHINKSLDHPNIVKLLDVVRCSTMKTASFIFQNFEHQDFRQIYPKMTLDDIRIYMKQLFSALDYLHSKGLMHRDIKPFNVLINHNTKQLKLIDFGLTDYYFPSKENNVKVGSMYYKAPQLYFSNSQYDYRVDCWSAGMILAGMIFKKTPFMVGNDTVDQILKLTKLVGTKNVVQYIKDYRLTERKSFKKENICFDILVAFENKDIKEEPASTFEEFINKNNVKNGTWEALDLIKRLLVLDFKKRLTAKEALEHPFFQKVSK